MRILELNKFEIFRADFENERSFILWLFESHRSSLIAVVRRSSSASRNRKPPNELKYPELAI
jgi:hypothetical protein